METSSEFSGVKTRFKRRHTGDFIHKENNGFQPRRSFETFCKESLIEEAGIKPLSPDRKNYLFPNRLQKKKAQRYSLKVYSSSECNSRSITENYPKSQHLQPIPDSFLRGDRKSKEVVRNNDFFNVLPDEMILKVFKWLPKSSLGVCCQVSKRLNRLCQDEALWKRVDASGRILSFNHLQIILDKKPVYLRFSRACAMGCDVNNSIDCSQLTFLDMSMSQIESKVLSSIFKASPNIEKLSLEHLTITKELMSAMETFAPSLDTLNLAMSYNMDYVSFIGFLRKATKLERLNIGCIVQEWKQFDLMKVINSLPTTLDQINLSGFRNIMTDNHIKLLVRRCPELIDLDLSDSQELTQTSIEYISRKLALLQHLGLSRCYSIEPASYRFLQGMKFMKYLELFSIFKDSSLKTLSASLPGIHINTFPLSAIARPTVGDKRSSIWGQRVRD